ncbi:MULTISPECIES: trigger factor [Prevotellaceae]|uniref:trigger factor n=1 Tax=Prevotellaceae TaxID=171552 RepID=UPI0008A22963|nr:MULTISPECIES: trigger factor [Prevotellaceae]OFO71697.1 trigger factor [Prevotella sp. HMSC077E08]OFP33089.1 trigger factor [Prevotella sp. HMSC069G02]OFP54798.1 trigger factor [Prevotella sp. HMSC077E09]
MNISFENPDKVNGLLTITVEEADYQASVEKTLKDYRKKANYPGFRPGMVPMGLIKKQFGASAKMDAINKLIGEQIYKYMQDNKIQMLGEPLPSEKQEAQDLEKPAPYTFAFDIAVAPEFKIELNGHNKIDHYTITVDDALIDRQVDMFASRSGSYEKAESYEDNDMLKGDLRELDEQGNTKEGGVTVEAASIMPNYIKNEAQKALFNGAKLGDIITINPSEAYESEAEIASLLKVERDRVKDFKGNFSYQITDIQRYKKHPVDQELFDQMFGKDTVKDEKAFREKIAEGLKAQLAVDADYKFILDVRAYCEKKVGKLQFPDALLKRIMLNNNKDKGEEFVEKNYEQSVKELTWHLIKEQLVAANQIKVDDADVLNAAKETARVQFAQYGMNNVPDEYVENYAKEILKKRENVDGLVDRAVDIKLTDALKKVVKLNEKEISLDDFNKMMSE